MTSAEPIPYDVASLEDLKAYPDLLAHVERRLSTFPCSRSEHLERFAQGGYRGYEKHGHSRTYVLLTPSTAHEIDVPAIFSVGQTSVDFSQASSSLRKRLMGNYSQDRTGAYLIAELARSDDYGSADLPGRLLLEEAMAAIGAARQHVGGRYVLVDSQTGVFEHLYEPYGFRRLGLCDPPRGMEGKEFMTSVMVLKGR
ncbi:hypothetical protein [Ruania rhizosphaerae]|uniref:hypothetical protein n=1 Tax=Ruania rhizosphaerae TaxID=1840413 RepID=UPI00135A683C|nr:hypothetical protein [Ruania rhizosphaerae]